MQNTQMTAWAEGRFSYQVVHIITTGHELVHFVFLPWDL